MSEANQKAIDPQTLTPPNPYIYKSQIAEHIRSTLRDPMSVQGLRIAEPFAANDAAGNPRWIVCVEYNAKNGYGGYVGSMRYAYKFAYGKMWGPHDAGSPVYSGICDGQFPLKWQAWKI